MENQKNLFLAIIISMAIIFGFQLLVPQPERAPVTEENNAQDSVSLDIQGTISAILLDRDQVLEEIKLALEIGLRELELTIFPRVELLIIG